MNRKLSQSVLLLLIAIFIFSCEKEPPSVETFTPDFGPAETLITVEGMHFNELIAIDFNDGVDADFNPSFGTGEALLFRVPENAPLGDNMVRIETDHGVTEFPFRVTLKPPSVSISYPETANIGESVTILGENFYEPLEVLFFDSIAGNILFSAEDSIVVEVPQGVTKGRINVKANGGSALTPTLFFTTTQILVNDFDGEGVRSETNKWIFYGAIDQNANTAIQNTNPLPIDNNYLKISGTDPGTVWIGGCESHSWDTDQFEVFDLSSSINDTYLSIDVNSNGRDKTHLIIVLAERDGSPNDFTTTVPVDWAGWETVELPLNKFTDIDGFPIDPTKIKTVKLHLYNELNSTFPLEVNVDNIQFVQVN